MRVAAVRLAIVVVLSACFAGCSSPTAIFGQGFYAEEPSLDGSTFRWMSAKGSIALAPSTADMVLEIAITVPLDLLPSAPTVELLLNDKPLDQIAVTEKEITKRYEVAKSALTSGASAQLRIQTSQTFVPGERDTSSKDRRRLGLIVRSVQWTPK